MGPTAGLGPGEPLMGGGAAGREAWLPHSPVFLSPSIWCLQRVERVHAWGRQTFHPQWRRSGLSPSNSVSECFGSWSILFQRSRSRNLCFSLIISWLQDLVGPRAGEGCRGLEHDSWGSDTGILTLLNHPPAGRLRLVSVPLPLWVLSWG